MVLGLLAPLRLGVQNNFPAKAQFIMGLTTGFFILCFECKE